MALRKFRGKCFTSYSEAFEGTELNRWTIGGWLVCPKWRSSETANSVMHPGLRDFGERLGKWEVGFPRVAARLLHSKGLCSDKVSFSSPPERTLIQNFLPPPPFPSEWELYFSL